MTDMNKTQFLVEDVGGATTRLRRFKRRRGYILVDRSGAIIRAIEWEEWLALRKHFPDEVEKDGLCVYIAWFLKEVK